MCSSKFTIVVLSLTTHRLWLCTSMLELIFDRLPHAYLSMPAAPIEYETSQVTILLTLHHVSRASIHKSIMLVLLRVSCQTLAQHSCCSYALSEARDFVIRTVSLLIIPTILLESCCSTVMLILGEKIAVAAFIVHYLGAAVGDVTPGAVHAILVSC